jgi:sulfite exporter TauE/SafE
MWITAIIVGFVGSLHCLGMCSPLIVAVTNWRSPQFINRLVYNTSRITCYGFQGALISLFGSLFSFSDFQIIFSIVLGAALLAIGLAGVTHVTLPGITFGMQKFTSSIKGIFSRALTNRSMTSMFLLVFLNGLLPCGLTYLALTYCIILPNTLAGFSFMLFFGIGTLPVMLGFTSLVQKLSLKYSVSFKKLTTVALIAMGLLLIARSIVPHHSSSISNAKMSVVICK